MKITAIVFFLIPVLTVCQTADPDLLKSKDQIMAGGIISYLPSSYLESDARVGSTVGIQYQSQFLKIGVWNSSIALRDPINSQVDTLGFRDISIAGSINFKKLAFGHRLFDLHGVLFLPSLDMGISAMRSAEQKQLNLKVSPTVGFQFPFFGIDFRLNTLLRLKDKIEGVKGFSVVPEIGLKMDGLYNLLDAKRVYIGHAEGTISSRETSYSTTTHRDGDFWVTTTYRTEYTRIMPYSFDRYATIVGPLAAIGVHYGFQNRSYAGPTRTVGIGYYLRGGRTSADFIYDVGKIGFASTAIDPPTMENPSPNLLGKVNKEDFSRPGYYYAQRVQARFGVDLVELYLGSLGEDAAVGRGQGKFSRVIGGLGLGYAFLSKPKYTTSAGRQMADSIYNNDLTLLTSSANHAAFGKSGTYLTFYCSLEAGAVRITFESNRYFQASLANVKSISIGYMLPYNRIKKKLVALRSLKGNE